MGVERKVKWFKLVGATDDPVHEDWEHVEPGIFTRLHFALTKPPNRLSNGEPIIIYTVVSGALIATQTVDGPTPPTKRSDQADARVRRWPWEIVVETHHYCSPLKSAPKLREVAPDFAKKYAALFREGSHWQIDDDEYQRLAAAIEAAGRPYRQPA
jgi:hypothetical protein